MKTLQEMTTGQLLAHYAYCEHKREMAERIDHYNTMLAEKETAQRGMDAVVAEIERRAGEIDWPRCRAWLKQQAANRREIDLDYEAHLIEGAIAQIEQAMGSPRP